MEMFHQLSKSPSAVLPYLAEMDLFAKMNPVIEKIEKLDDNRYRVHEKMKMGPVFHRVSYPMTLEIDPTIPKVEYHAVISGMAHIYITMILSGDHNHCQVQETIRFRSFLPLFFMIKSIFIKQHRILFENIDQAG